MEHFQQMPDITRFLIMYAALLLAISVHESSHALSAYLLGDETSKHQNRISLNPIDHIDIFGTLIFPVLAFFMHIPVIGWAKPVMVDPRNLRDPKRDDIFISAAGPASNLFLGILMIACYPLLRPMLTEVPALQGFYEYGILINIILAFFNLIPIPPLDGSGILRGFLPPSLEEKYDSIGGMGFLLLYALLLLGVLDIVFNLAYEFLRSIYMAVGIG